ncbi:MAG: M56 family metallopeptidase [Bacteroidales bacterium]|nr:M56 family metallopeptidase [Bacteroidales bacterium]
MNTQEYILGFAVPVALAIMILWLAYRLLFVNSNRFQFNRFFLLGSLLFSVALPFIGFEMGNSVPEIALLRESLFPGFTLNEVVITPEGTTTQVLDETVVTGAPAGYSLWTILGIVYLLGVGVMSVLFLFKLVRIIALILRSPKQKMDGYTAVYTHRDQGSFSFFRYAFFPDETVSPDIVRHEKSHIVHGHSWDIIYAELMCILQWFNPFVYLYKKELRSLHEYAADHDVVASGADKKDYAMLILQQCTAVDFSSMSNNFSLILTKKRIKMIAKHEKAKGFWWKLLATIPVLAVLLFVNTKVTAQEQSDQPIRVEMGRFEISDDDGNPVFLRDTVIYNEDGSYVKCTTSDSDVIDPNTGEPLKKMTITTHNADGTPNGNMNLHWDVDGEKALYEAEPFDLTEGFLPTLIGGIEALADAQERDSVYQIVEVMPEYPGGMDQLAKYLSENIKYPDEAKEKGISGRVFISYVIEKDGSVSNIKVMRSVSPLLDNEAVRVVKAMPKWKPGKQKGKAVRVNYILPVNFKLDDGDKSPEDEVERALEKAKKPNKEGVYQIAETMPEYPGGMDGLRAFLQENLSVPEKYKDMDTKADYRVFVQFVVAEDGSITNVELLKPEPSKQDLNDEAIRVVKGMPKWKPGTVDGKPVKVRYTLPVLFRLGK